MTCRCARGMCSTNWQHHEAHTSVLHDRDSRRRPAHRRGAKAGGKHWGWGYRSTGGKTLLSASCTLHARMQPHRATRPFSDTRRALQSRLEHLPTHHARLRDDGVEDQHYDRFVTMPYRYKPCSTWSSARPGQRRWCWSRRAELHGVIASRFSPPRACSSRARRARVVPGHDRAVCD